MTGPVQLLKRMAASILMLILLPSWPVLAQEAEPAAKGYVMPDTEVWDLRAPDGYPYRIFISKPRGEPPEGGYPVLYVLDGNAIFASFAEMRRIQESANVGKSIIVGVGYPTEKPYAERRLYDMSGPMPPPSPWDSNLGDLPYGGWDEFLDFLTGELRAEVDRRYDINPDRQALFGHSLGGLFAVHALYSRPDAFHAIIAASPSLFWHDHMMLKEEEKFRKRLRNWEITKLPRLMVVVGELEETVLERWDGEDFAKRMEPLSAYGLYSRFELYRGEGHMTVPVRAVAETLRFAFSWP